jgi:diguanylate cyclase
MLKTGEILMKRVWALFAILCLALLCAGSAAGEELTIPEHAMLDKHGAIILFIEPITGNIVYANEAAVAFYGYPREQLLQMQASQINTVSPEETEKEMQAALAAQTNFFVFENRVSSGEIKTVEVFSYPVNRNGRNLLFTIVHDITEATLLSKAHDRLVTSILIAGGITIAALIALSIALLRSRQKIKSDKDAIENSQKLHKTFIDADDSLIYLKDENFKYVFVNKATEAFYHRTENEIVGLTDYDLSDEEFAKRRREVDLKALSRNEVIPDEVEWDGRIYRALKFPVPMPSGMTGIGAYITDITEARKNEKKQEKVLYRHKILADMLSRSFESKQAQLDYVLHEALKLTESQFGYIYLYDEEKRQLTLNSWTNGVMEACAVEEKPTTYDLTNTGLWGEVVRQRKPIVINDFEAPNPLKKGYPNGHVPLRKFMSVPVIIDDKIVATIGLANKPSDYEDDDIYQTILLMSGVWNAVVRKETQDKLFLERNRYQQTLLSIGDGVMVVDRDGRIEMLNPVAQELIGWSQESAAGIPYKEVFALSHEQAGMNIKDPIEDAMITQTVQEMENHAVLTSRDGKRYYLEDSAAPIKDETGAIIGVVLVFRNVTEKKEQQQEIEYLSFHDAMTGLYNRHFFEEEMRRVDTLRNLPVSIIIGDVNNLKLANDVFGHTYGDMLLKRLSQVMKRVCRADDIIARWGGDEFALLLPKTGLAEARQIVSRIREEFSKERIKAVRGSISMGAAAKISLEESVLDLINRAEEEMYLNKIVEHNEVMKGTLQTIVQLLHDNSPREKEHAVRVSQLCAALGKKLNMTEDEVKRLRDAGFLHDIGKVVLDSKLLENHYQLSTREWDEIKRHPVVGYRILNAFDDMLDLAQIVLAHQERWDGTGYPKGLKGEEIPKASRIIALAESYERKRAGAENRAPVSREEALEAIRQDRGMHFDPALTDLFVDMMKKEDPEFGEE